MIINAKRSTRQPVCAGHKGIVAAYIEGLNTSDQSVSNEVTKLPSKSKHTNTINLIAGKKKSQKKTQINIYSEPMQVKFHPIKSEHAIREGGKQDCLQRSSIGCQKRMEYFSSHVSVNISLCGVGSACFHWCNHTSQDEC